VRGQIVRRTRPLFYIFFGLVNFWRDVFEFERVLGVLMCDEENPSRLPQGVVDELREREAPDGVIKFDTKRRRRFGPGAKVCIKHGVMVGFSGIVERLQSRDRVTVLLDLLGRKTSVLLRETELTAA